MCGSTENTIPKGSSGVKTDYRAASAMARATVLRFSSHSSDRGFTASTAAPMLRAMISALLPENWGETKTTFTPRRFASVITAAISAAFGSFPSTSMATSSRPYSLARYPQAG